MLLEQIANGAREPPVLAIEMRNPMNEQRALPRDNARVTRLVQRRLAADPKFRPRSGAETPRVAELSRLAGDCSSAQALLIDFEQHFPGDLASAQAAAMSVQLRRS